MKRYDIAIIGTGPAGLSAALTAKARNKSFLLFGSRSLSPKVQKAHRVLNYLGLPNASGQELQAAFLSQIEGEGIEITEEKATLVYPMGDYFSIQAGSGIYEASAVIIAAGMAPQKLLPGEEEFLGRGVSYCATCDAALYRGKTAAIVGYSPEDEGEARFMREYASKVTYVPMYEGAHELGSGIEVVRTSPKEIVGKMKAEKLVTSDGEIAADGFFILRESVPPSQLVPGIAMDKTHIAVGRAMETNVPGCFAAGDITGTPYQYMKSAGEGNVAALSAVKYLDAVNIR